MLNRLIAKTKSGQVDEPGQLRGWESTGLMELRLWFSLLNMKSAYELAMERLNKTAPSAKTSPKQKKELAELDSLYAAKIAERELALNGEIAHAAEDVEKEDSLRAQLVNERRKLQAELEEKKERVRSGLKK